jgi:hypothetical protein
MEGGGQDETEHTAFPSTHTHTVERNSGRAGSMVEPGAPPKKKIKNHKNNPGN